MIFFRKRRLEKLKAGAREYVAARYEDPSVKKNDPPAADDGHIQFQHRYPADPEISVTAEPRKRDSYDSSRVESAMKSLMGGGFDPAAMKALSSGTKLSFVDKMLEHIDRMGLADSAVYKAAQVDRRLFSKIVSDREYKPAKDTCVALCFAMKLDLSQTLDMLERAGYTLSHSSKRDVALEYFFKKGFGNVTEINAILSDLDMKILGRE